MKNMYKSTQSKHWYNQLPWWGWLLCFLIANQAGAYMMKMGDPVMMTVGASVGMFGIYALAALIATAIKRPRSGGIEKTARMTARTVLTSFLALRKKHNYPIESPTDKIRIYKHILKLRNYSDEAIYELLQEAQKISDAKGAKQGITLNTLVYVIVSHEYVMDTQKNLTDEQLLKVENVLDEIYRG